MADKFGGSDGVMAPGRDVFLITPHVSNPVDPLPKAIRANEAGTITFRAADSAADVTMTFAAGEVLEVRALYVRVTGTTVTNIHGIA